MDRQVIARIALYASVAVLALLALSTPTIAYVARIALLVPAAFAVAGAILLALPILSSEHAEGRHVNWRLMLDFAEHSTIVAFADLMLLWCTVGIAAMGLAAMPTDGVAAFAVATTVGFAAALTDWLLGQERDSVQELWQNHPN